MRNGFLNRCRVWFFAWALLGGMMLGGLGGLGGCATTGGGDRGSFNVVVSEDVPLKEAGPEQTVPAGLVLRRGTRVRLVNKAGRYSMVETIEGHRGFVPTGVLQIQGEEPSSSAPGF